VNGKSAEHDTPAKVSTAIIYESGDDGYWLGPGEESVLLKEIGGRLVIDIFLDGLFQAGFRKVLCAGTIPENVWSKRSKEWQDRLDMVSLPGQMFKDMGEALFYWKGELREGFAVLDAAYFIDFLFLKKVLSSRGYVKIIAAFSMGPDDSGGPIKALLFGKKLVNMGKGNKENTGFSVFLGWVVFTREAAAKLIEIVGKPSTSAKQNLSDILLSLKNHVKVYGKFTGRLKWAYLRKAEWKEKGEEVLNSLVDSDRSLQSVIKFRDGLVATFVSGPMANRVVRLIADTGITPNQVTALSLVLGLGVAAIFAYGTWTWLAIGAVLLQVSFILDCVDGQLARYKDLKSNFGGWLDSMTDRLKEYAAYLGLAYGGWVKSGNIYVWLFLFSASLLLAYKHLDGYYRKSLQEGEGAIDELAVALQNDRVRKLRLAVIMSPYRNWVRWVRTVFNFGIGERLAVISICALAGRPIWALAILSIGNFVSTFYNHTRNWQLYIKAQNSAHRKGTA